MSYEHASLKLKSVPGPATKETPAERWARMRKWASDQLRNG